MPTNPQPPHEDLAKAYDPSAIESKWAAYWVEQNLFATPEAAPGQGSFTMLLPPPNVTGRLHLGHMFEQTEMDILTRWHRMRGDRTLWLPGTDHASIATQMMVERQIAAEGVTTREAMGRDAFLDKAWAWKHENGDAITTQMRRLGASVDWSREYFTMDENLSHAVTEAFVRLYRQGLIYRGAYIVNWDPQAQTAVSDLEVESEDRPGFLYHIAYPLADGTGSIPIATTRPETLLGDVAVAVNPADPRYRHLVGKLLDLPLSAAAGTPARQIPILADDWAKPEFGTGAVKVTPAHDPNDFAIGQRHALASLTILTKTAHIDLPGSPYHGLDRFAARKRILADLEALGLLLKAEPHTIATPISQRTGAVIEPRLSDQWFVAVNKTPADGSATLAHKSLAAVREGHIKFVPDMYRTIYENWMENIYDWCISRQLWWGQRIPAWYCERMHINVAHTAPATCSTCGSSLLTQDPDVLDTWFSSGLLPVSLFGWPAGSPGPQYPTDLLVTGFDILFFWVARMIMLGTHFMLEAPMPDGSPRPLAAAVPFREVYIHGLIRAADKQKMSKTKGNVIDPIGIIERFGTDAVRFTLASMASPGTDIAFSEARTEGYRAFANKIWNAARFLQMNVQRGNEVGITVHLEAESTKLVIKPTTEKAFAQRFASLAMPRKRHDSTLETVWILSRLSNVAQQVDFQLGIYRFDQAATLVYDYFWAEFCGWYLEALKVRLDFDSQAARSITEAALQTALEVLEASLRLLSPFMPFITEELWQGLFITAPAPSIALTWYPQHVADLAGPVPEMDILQEVITLVRQARKQSGVPDNIFVPLQISSIALNEDIVKGELNLLQKLARVTSVEFVEELPAGQDVYSSPTFDVRVLYERQIDIPAERERLGKDLARYEKGLQAAEKQLGNESFTARAPAHIIEGLRRQQAATQLLHDKTKAALAQLP